jgi:hypothetical protein
MLVETTALFGALLIILFLVHQYRQRQDHRTSTPTQDRPPNAEDDIRRKREQRLTISSTNLPKSSEEKTKILPKTTIVRPASIEPPARQTKEAPALDVLPKPWVDDRPVTSPFDEVEQV